MKQNPFYILCLSGGGARGIFQASLLHHLSQRIEQPYYKQFDMIAGTSTGAIIGIALSLGISTDRILQFYKEKSSEIFSKNIWANLTSGSVYSSDILRKNLEEIFQTNTLKDAQTSLLVTASCLDQYKHKIFSNIGPSCQQDKKLTAVDVAMSSSAAPTYFSAVTPQGQDRTFVDGGLWANDPSIVAIFWANKYLGVEFSRIKLLSIGTGELPIGMSKKEFDEKKPYSPMFVKNIFETIFAAQSSFADYQTKEILHKNNLLRINPSLKEKIILDDYEKSIDQLLPLAENFLEDNHSEISLLLSNEPIEIYSPFSLVSHCHNITHILRDAICKLILKIESFNDDLERDFDDLKKNISLGENEKECLLQFFAEEIERSEVLNQFPELNTEVMNIEKTQNNLWKNLQESVLNLAHKFFSHVTSQLKCHLENALKLAGNDEKISISIKMIYDSHPARGTLSHDELNLLHVVTIFRDYETYVKNEREILDKKWSVGENTAFKSCYEGTSRKSWHFICNSMHSDLNHSDYKNQRQKFWQFYDATIVVPIQDEKGKRANVYGFLTADCLNRSKKEIFTFEHHFDILAHSADVIATFFKTVDMQLPDLFKTNYTSTKGEHYA